ncbi:MAG: C2H2-type zinc finger protein [Candidatus Helarchaeota archaeon]
MVKHDIGEVQYECTQPNCEFKTSLQSRLKKHLTQTHGIGETKYYPCPEPNCDYKAKAKGNLNKHIRRRHKKTLEAIPVESTP